MAPRFCPRCHREVPLPDIVKKVRVTGSGKLRVQCGNCQKGYINVEIEPAPV